MSAPLLRDNPAVRAIFLETSSQDIITGTSDGEIVQIHVKTGQLTVLVQGHGLGELWGLAPHPTEAKYATASDDKTVRVWCAESHRMLLGWKMKKECRSVGFSMDGNILAVGMKDGSIIFMDVTRGKEINKFRHRKEEISDIKFSPDNKYCAVASHDNFVDIYNVKKRKRCGICKGASSYITHIDWDTSGKLLVINSGAKEVLFYEAPRGERQVLSHDAISSIEWATMTCTLGDQVEGIWPPHSDVTDVNTASLREGVLVTGDDFGLVKLFTYPVLGKFAKFKKYHAHSAHVTNVRWLMPGNHVVSVGGADTAVCVWAYGGKAREQKRRKSEMVACAGESDDSATDSEEEGYDSDVDREKNTDYRLSTYSDCRRTMAGAKPTGKSSHANRKRVSRAGKAKLRVKKGSQQKNRMNFKEKSGLRLTHIFGYRGFDARDNIGFLPDGQLVYHAAAVGIVYNPSTNKQRFYLDHTDDIISLAVNPARKFGHVIATGQLGKHALIHVWDSENLETLSTIQGYHEVAVCSLGFSPNGKSLVSVDVNRNLAVYRWSTGHLLGSIEADHRRVFVAKFRPDSDVHFVTCGVKHIKFWTVAGSQLLVKRGIVSRGTKMPTMLSCAFGPPGVTVSGSMMGNIYVWTDNVIKQIVTTEMGAHSGPVFSMTNVQDSIISGGKDGQVLVWNQSFGKPSRHELPGKACVRAVARRSSSSEIVVGTASGDLMSLKGHSKAQEFVPGHAQGAMWGLCTHPSKHEFATTSNDKTVCIFDIKTRTRLYQADLPDEGRCVCYSPDGKCVAVGLSNGEIHVFTDKLKPVHSWRERRLAIQDMKYCPKGKLLAAGSNDKMVDFYSVSNNYERCCYCSGIKETIIHIDWDKDGKLIQVNTGAYEVVYVNAEDGTIATNVDPTKVIWSSWNSVLGSAVVGVWPKNAENGDVNCVDVAQCGKKMVTGDDFGFVKLFDFPAEQPFTPPSARYSGHSDHVTNTRWSYDDAYVISVGGADSCAFVWTTQHM